MNHSFSGSILFLDRDDINTDEIIPAKYLTEASREALKPYLLEDLRLDGFSPGRDLPGKSVLVSKANFGCGSSREHAPWALEVNGIRLVIAKSFARIFKQNMFNCGMMAVSLPEETMEEVFRRFCGRSTVVRTDLDRSVFEFRSDTDCWKVPFALTEFEWRMIRSGGWVNYADENY